MGTFNGLHSSIKMQSEPWYDYMCLIKINSSFYYFWEVLRMFTTMYFLLFFSMQIAVSELLMMKHLQESSGQHDHHYLEVNQIFSRIMLLDFLYKLIVEHQINDEEKTVLIKNSIKHYLKKGFLLDLVTNLVMIIYTIETWSIERKINFSSKLQKNIQCEYR